VLARAYLSPLQTAVYAFIVIDPPPPGACMPLASVLDPTQNRRSTEVDTSNKS
jgi:hypothetical protein